MYGTIKPLLLDNLKNGQRHYFDCFDSAMGALIAFYLDDNNIMKKYYASLNAPGLFINDMDELVICRRYFNIEKYVSDLIGLQIVELVSIPDATAIVNSGLPCVVVYDEFYVKENIHFTKKHFTHAALLKRIVNETCFVTLDPNLVVEAAGKTFSERTIHFNESEEEHIMFYLAEDTSMVKNAQEVVSLSLLKLREMNKDVWENSLSCAGSQLFFGKEALNILEKNLSAFTGLSVISKEFYKWIYPLYWEYKLYSCTEKNITSENQKILKNLIKDLEILELGMMRIMKKYKKDLHVYLLTKLENVSKNINILLSAGFFNAIY